ATSPSPALLSLADPSGATKVVSPSAVPGRADDRKAELTTTHYHPGGAASGGPGCSPGVLCWPPRDGGPNAFLRRHDRDPHSPGSPVCLLILLSPVIGSPILPDPLPIDPVPLLRAWPDEAMRARRVPDPNAFVLATADSNGRPSSRVVLCKAI